MAAQGVLLELGKIKEILCEAGNSRSGDADMEDRVPNCSICLEPVIQTESRSTAQLACHHHFHLDCIGSAFNAKGSMECPNCRRVEDGNWLMLGGSQSADDAIYDVPYDFDDDEYPSLDVLDSEMREYMEAGRDASYTTHPYHPPGAICEFCEQHYCDDNPCPHIVQCPFFLNNISQPSTSESPFSSVSAMEAEAYAETMAELYHMTEYRGSGSFSAPPQSAPAHHPPEMHASSSANDSSYVYYFSSSPRNSWQGGGATWGDSNPPTWASSWQQQDRRQDSAHTTTFVQSSTMITSYGPQAPATPGSIAPPSNFSSTPVSFPPHAPNPAPLFANPPLHNRPQAGSPMLSPRTPLQTTPPFSNRAHSHSFSEAPLTNGGYSNLHDTTPLRNREDIHTSSAPSSSPRPGPLTYAGVLGRRQQPTGLSRRNVNPPQERLVAQPWRSVSDAQAGGASGRFLSPSHYHHHANGTQSSVCPYLANNARSSQGLVGTQFGHYPSTDSGQLAPRQGLPLGGQSEAVARIGGSGFEPRPVRSSWNGEDLQPGAEGLLAMLELNDGMWLQDRHSLFVCSFCTNPARPRSQTERRFVNRDALSQHMRAVHGVHLDPYSLRS